jgi:hypothetical protein
MPARVSFSYAVIRVVPRVDRQEIVNVGVVLHCPQRAFLDAGVAVDDARLRAAFPGIDLDAVANHLRVICQMCAGDPAAGPLAALPLSERFHWVVAPRSTIVQPSVVHAGLTDDPRATLEHLVDSMVRLPHAS